MNVRQESRETVVAHVVGLAGSLRPGSATQMAVRCALLGAEDVGARTQLLDLASYDPPFLGRDIEPTRRSAVERFRATSAQPMESFSARRSSTAA